MARLGKHIALKMGVPVEDNGMNGPDLEKEHSLEDGLAFVTLFQGIE